jgi:hypothetical protein
MQLGAEHDAPARRFRMAVVTGSFGIPGTYWLSGRLAVDVCGHRMQDAG